MLDNLTCYVLSIETAEGPRRANAARQLEDAPFRWSFVKGYAPDDPFLVDLYSPRLNLIHSKRSLTGGEIAVYAGHRKIWKMLAESGASHALVLEDDFAFCSESAVMASLAELMACSGDWDIVKLFDFSPNRIVRRRQVGAASLVKYDSVASGAVAYLISRRAAEALLSRPQIYRQVDEDLAHPWEFSLDIWSTSPNLVVEISETVGGSLLEDDRQRIKRDGRNVLRSVYGNLLRAKKRLRSYLHETALAARRA